MVPGPHAVKEGIIWSAWQLRLILPRLCPHSHSLGNHPKLTDTGADALSQVERDYLSPVALPLLMSSLKVSIMQDLLERKLDAILGLNFCLWPGEDLSQTSMVFATAVNF